MGRGFINKFEPKEACTKGEINHTGNAKGNFRGGMRNEFLLFLLPSYIFLQMLLKSRVNNGFLGTTFANSLECKWRLAKPQFEIKSPDIDLCKAFQYEAQRSWFICQRCFGLRSIIVFMCEQHKGGLTPTGTSPMSSHVLILPSCSAFVCTSMLAEKLTLSLVFTDCRIPSNMPTYWSLNMTMNRAPPTDQKHLAPFSIIFLLFKINFKIKHEIMKLISQSMAALCDCPIDVDVTDVRDFQYVFPIPWMMSPKSVCIVH